MNKPIDLSPIAKAIAIAERLVTGLDGQAHLPPALAFEIRLLTPKEPVGQSKHLPPLKPKDIERIIDLRRTGHTYREIQQRTGIGYYRIAHVIQQHNQKRN